MPTWSAVKLAIWGRKSTVQGFGKFGQDLSPPPDDMGGTVSKIEEGHWALTASWGYFSASFEKNLLDPIVSFLEEQFQTKFVDKPAGKFYSWGLNGGDGLHIDCDNLQDQSLRVQIPPDWISSIPTDRLQHFIAVLDSFNPHCTRFDATLDLTGYNRPSPRSIWRGLDSGKFYLVGFRHKNFLFDANGDKETQGDTLYIGKRKNSDKYLRWYDSKGPLRLESEFKEDKAPEAWRAFVQASQGKGEHRGLAETIAGMVIGSVDFRMNIYKNSSENPVAPWWEKIKNLVRTIPIKLQVSRRKRNDQIERLARWFDKQVSKPLAKISLAYGPSFVHYLDFVLEHGHQALTETDRALCTFAIPAGIT